MEIKFNLGNEVVLNAIEIVNKLQNAGFKAYFVGGAVRDALLGEEIKDIDITTSAKPDEIKDVIADISEIKFIDVGESFNIVMAILNKKSYEIATFRGEEDYLDGRRPKKVYFANSPKEDAARRDFTINALFYDPIKGEFLDFFNGIEDIKNKLIRSIRNPEDRFSEDYLRMLRAIRFAAQKNFIIEEGTYLAIQKLCYNMMRISKERIRQELDKIILSENAGTYVAKLADSGLYKEIFGQDFSKDLIIPLNVARSFYVRYAILLKDISDSDSFMRELTFDNETRNKVLWLIGNSKITKIWDNLGRFEKLELISDDNFDDLLELLKSLRIGVNNLKTLRREFEQDEERFNQMRKFTLITGKDLISMGIEPGPEMGEIISKAKRDFIFGKFKTKNQILNDIKVRL